jgi:hypothetical protein
MTSRSGASVAQPSWGTPVPAAREASVRAVPPLSHPVARWGIRGDARSDVAAGVALLAATAGLWTAFLLCVG